MLPSSPHVSDQAKDFIRKCLAVDENKRFRVKDMVQHEILETRSMTPVERVPPRKPFDEIQNLNIPTEPSHI